MTTYKGNAGNLMQHWTLCELVNIADEHVSGLNFIDAHAMAPLAFECPNPDSTFRGVRQGLLNGQSVYERAWHELALNGGYPNSANFVKHIWKREFAMLLCERRRVTVAAFDTWLSSVQSKPRCKRAKVFCGDWRARFDQGLPNPADLGLPPGSMTFLSFDPYKYDCNRLYNDPNREGRVNLGDLYRDDVERALVALGGVKDGIVIQLSTYSANNNPQADVLASVDSILAPGGFGLAAQVVFDDNMVSLVYARDVPDALETELKKLSKGFNQWSGLWRDPR